MNFPHTTVCKLLILDRNTWYHITMCRKLLRNNYTKNVDINVQWTQFSNQSIKYPDMLKSVFLLWTDEPDTKVRIIRL